MPPGGTGNKGKENKGTKGKEKNIPSKNSFKGYLSQEINDNMFYR